MTTFQPYTEFTAQSKTLSALMFMYHQIENDPRSGIEFTQIVVFLAFSIESYLNSIGARKLEIWDELERLPWKKKIAILHKIANKPLDWSQGPLQFAQEVFTLRDKLAHGKPETVFGPIFDNRPEAQCYLATGEIHPDWYKKISREWVMDAKKQFHTLMVYLGRLFDLHESDHLLKSTSGVRIDDGQGA